MNGIKPLSRSCYFLFSLHAGAFYMTLVLHAGVLSTNPVLPDSPERSYNGWGSFVPCAHACDPASQRFCS